MPTPTPTPEPLPTSCMDDAAEQRVLQAFLHEHILISETFTEWLVQKMGLARFLPYSAFSKTPYLLDLGKVVLIGTFRIELPGGHGNCLTVAYPAKAWDPQGNEIVVARVVSGLTDVTVSGVWSNSWLDDNTNDYAYHFSEDAVLAWVQARIGRVTDTYAIIFANDPEKLDADYAFMDLETDNWSWNRSLLQPYARNGYIGRYGADDTLFKAEYEAMYGPVNEADHRDQQHQINYDPAVLERLLHPDEVGFILGLVSVFDE